MHEYTVHPTIYRNYMNVCVCLMHVSVMSGHSASCYTIYPDTWLLSNHRRRDAVRCSPEGRCLLGVFDRVTSSLAVQVTYIYFYSFFITS